MTITGFYTPRMSDTMNATTNVTTNTATSWHAAWQQIQARQTVQPRLRRQISSNTVRRNLLPEFDLAANNAIFTAGIASDAAFANVEFNNEFNPINVEIIQHNLLPEFNRAAEHLQEVLTLGQVSTN